MAKLDKALLFEDIEKLKPFPVIARKALSLLSDERVSSKAIGDIVIQDQIIAGKILQIANSYVYGGLRDCTTVTQAITRIGFDNTLKIVLAVCTAGMFDNAKSYEMEERGLWRHSLSVSLLSELIINKKHLNLDIEKVFIAALMHDIGKSVLGKYSEQCFDELLSFSRKNNKDFHSAEREILGIDHCEVSEMIMKHWNIPDEVIIPAKYHHNPKSFSISLSNNMLNVIYIADIIANNIGIGNGYDKNEANMDVDILRRIGLTENDLHEIQAEFISKIDLVLAELPS